MDSASGSIQTASRIVHPPAGSSALPFVLLLIGLVLLAWHNRFVQDDAFISFRYAENLANGHGLVWNAGQGSVWNDGERVEGYTNFLWVVALAGLIRAGVDPLMGSYILGLLCFVGTLIATCKLAYVVSGSRATALLAVALLGTNYTFSSYATGGLETQLQAFLATTALAMICQAGLAGKLGSLAALRLSGLFAALALVRLDSAVIVLPIVIMALTLIMRTPGTTRHRLHESALLLLPATLIVAGWFCWKLVYYGHVLPNTFFVKVGAQTSIGQGLRYVLTFFVSYLHLIFVGLLVLRSRIVARHPNSKLILFNILSVTLWLAYVAFVGGDFMEFRFIVPVMPAIYALLAFIISELIVSRALRIAAVALCLTASIWHLATFKHHPGIESIDMLAGHVAAQGKGWTNIGRKLFEAFGQAGDVSIAVTPAGAIPYYSRLPCVDMLGLNDRWIARHGMPIGSASGHFKMATIEYLMRREVNLLIGHPFVIASESRDNRDWSIEDLSKIFLNRKMDGWKLLIGMPVIRFPLGNGHQLVCIYLTRSRSVDEMISKQGCQVSKITE